MLEELLPAGINVDAAVKPGNNDEDSFAAVIRN